MEEVRDSLLYILDASESMKDSGVFANALSAACEFIRGTAKQGIAHFDAGVVVFNVATSTGTKTLLDMGEPSIDGLKALFRICEHPELIYETVTSSKSSGTSLIGAIRVAKAEMNKLRTKSLRRVILVTDNDNPFQDSNNADVATNLVSDLVNSPAILVPVFVNPPNRRFDVSKFWIRLEYAPPTFDGNNEHEVENLKPINGSMLFSKQQKLLGTKSRRKHVTVRGSIRLQSLNVGVKGYNIVSLHSTRPSAFNIGVLTGTDGKETREILNASSVMAKVESGTEVNPEVTPLTLKFKLSSSMQEDLWCVDVSDEDYKALNDINQNETPYFEILNFVSLKSAISVQVDHGFVGHSVFLTPCNEKWENSEKAFGSLHRSLHRRSRAAVAIWHTSRESAAPVLGFVYADSPYLNLSDEQIELSPGTRSGMYFVPLPFEDSIRHIPSELNQDNLTSIMLDSKNEKVNALLGQVVKKFKLTSGFHPGRFTHPSYTQFTTILENLALSLPLEQREAVNGPSVPVEARDTTLPRYSKIDKMCHKLRPSLDQELSRYSEIEFHTKSKPAPQPKRAKLDLPSADDVKAAVKEGTLSKWTVAELTAAAKSLDLQALPPKKKADLLDYVQQSI